METRIATGGEIISAAFSDGEYMPPSAISEADIAAAEERYLIPVTGRGLYEQMLSGKYSALRGEYVVPAVAFAVRVMLQPALDVRTGVFGTTVPKSSAFGGATAEQARELRKSIRVMARTMLRRLSDYLDAHAAEYPEYCPENNVLKRCSTDGGIVQIY